MKTIPIDSEIAEEAAKLRAQWRLRIPDAIQLAVAISSGASWFLTNDMALSDVQAIKILVLSQMTPSSPA